MPKTSIKASIIIPTKNGGALFRRVLDAVLTQQTDWPYEVIIADSGSTDGTVEFVQQFSQVKLLQIPAQEFGHGRTRNQAIEFAQDEFVAMLTHDALPGSSFWLTHLVACAEQSSNIAGVFGRHIAYEHASPFTRQELELHFAGFESNPIVSLDDQQRYDTDLGYRQFLHFFSDNNALLRKSVWQTIPYPDVDFAEDQAWAKLIIEAGYKKAYCHEAWVYHSHDYSLWERFQRSFDESQAFNRWFGYRLCPGWKHLFRNWLALTLRDLKYAKTMRLWRSDCKASIHIIFDNFMRLSGHYLGSFGLSLPNPVLRLLSRDKRMMAGLIKEK